MKTNRVRFGTWPFGYKKLLSKLILSLESCEIYRMNHGKLTFGRKTKIKGEKRSDKRRRKLGFRDIARYGREYPVYNPFLYS